MASLMVLAYHVDDVMIGHGGAAPFGGLAHGAARGVDFLFVLSGFVMARLYLLDGTRVVDPMTFLRQRARRLLPAFWIVSLAALAAYATGMGGAEKLAKLRPDHVLASFLLLPQGMQPLLNVSWFLVYEALFYLLVALMLFERRLGMAAFGAWQALVLMLYLADVNVGPSEIPNYLSVRSLGLGIGLLCAMLARRVERANVPFGLSVVLLVASLIFFGDIAWEGTGERDTHGLSTILIDAAAGVMLLTAVTLERRGEWRTPRMLVACGAISYSTYLTHFAVLTVAFHALGRFGLHDGSGLALLCAAIAVCVGAAFHYLVDSPLQRALRRSGNGARQRAELEAPQPPAPRPV